MFQIRQCQVLLASCRDPGSPLSGEDGDPTLPPRPDFEPLAEDPHDEGRLGDQVPRADDARDSSLLEA